MRIFLAGVSCVGKTTIGARLAGLLEYRFFDLDVETERFFGTSIERLRNRHLTSHNFSPRGISSLEGCTISRRQLQLCHCTAAEWPVGCGATRLPRRVAVAFADFVRRKRVATSVPGEGGAEPALSLVAFASCEAPFETFAEATCQALLDRIVADAESIIQRRLRGMIVGVGAGEQAA